MATKPALVVALSSRALFDFNQDKQDFERERQQFSASSGSSPMPWEDHYMAFQRQRLGQDLPPGVAFGLAQKLLRFNRPDQPPCVDVVVVSRNDPISGMRTFSSAQALGLPIERGVFTRGQSPWPYLPGLGAHLFLSSHEQDVREALQAGTPAAQIFPHGARGAERFPDELRIAFDGDAVLFGDEAERVYQSDGLQAFQAHETRQAHMPLSAGPLQPLLQALHRLRQISADSGMRIRTALVTARGAPAHERALRTLMDWQIPIDQAFFLAGLPKAPFLAEFQPDFFFDDQSGHIRGALDFVPAGQVLHGVTNTPSTT